LAAAARARGSAAASSFWLLRFCWHVPSSQELTGCVCFKIGGFCKLALTLGLLLFAVGLHPLVIHNIIDFPQGNDDVKPHLSEEQGEEILVYPLPFRSPTFYSLRGIRRITNNPNARNKLEHLF
jgi:hypothetical protein